MDFYGILYYYIGLILILIELLLLLGVDISDKLTDIPFDSSLLLPAPPISDAISSLHSDEALESLRFLDESNNDSYKYF